MNDLILSQREGVCECSGPGGLQYGSWSQLTVGQMHWGLNVSSTQALLEPESAAVVTVKSYLRLLIEYKTNCVKTKVESWMWQFCTENVNVS